MAHNILVTGASRGIGVGLIRILTQSPQFVNKIYAISRKMTDELQKVIENNPGTVSHIKMDTKSEASIQCAANKIGEDLGGQGLNYLINNAAVGYYESIRETNEDHMLNVLTTNILGPTITIKEFLPLMEKSVERKERTIIVNMSSYVGSFGTTNHDFAFSYRISKAGLNMLTHSMHAYFQDKGIHILSLHPGHVITDLVHNSGKLTIDESAHFMLENVIKNPEPFNGKFVNYRGEILPW